MAAKRKQRRPSSDAAWQRRWAPIFRAAEEGLFPNRAFGALEMAECIRALRKSKIVGRSKADSR